MDEFESIDRLFRPLAGAPEALGLLDDAALLPVQPGCELVVTADAIVEGVHFLPDDPPDLVARKLLRVNLSDLAAKAAEPYGYVLTIAWSPDWDEARRTGFARGLGEDQALYGLKLFGGDKVSTPGPMTASVTMMGWVPEGRMVKRSGARAGDILLASGSIGDGYLGLKAARGEVDLPLDDLTYLSGRYRLPRPRVDLRGLLRECATAAADVSDGLLADAGHLGEASHLRVEVDLDRLPLSRAARLVLRHAQDEARDLLDLAKGGDDYEVVCTAAPKDAARLVAAGFTQIGSMAEGEGLSVMLDGRLIEPAQTGWRHG